ncbi:ROK family protein [Aquibacillus halophilus]|uniref:ROK family protein n=1 Tax=Aquibacillus halophilus TaxID=930132 RepID=A0A6A8DC92_9BACI|nr:ROK family protein [Aquibacillus halophilus]MRH43303.1 ROK family protein [Aquibacillus halophilus]
MKYALGIDVGGTKIASAIINADGRIVDKIQVASKPENENSMFQQVTLSIDRLMEKSNLTINQLEGIGVGLPGKVDVENGLAVFQNNLPWRNFPIVEKLSEYTKVSNIKLDNDVYMACFAEWQAHDPKEKEVFVYITVSTGIACSIIHNGEFIRGSGFAGELGLFPVQTSIKGTEMERLEFLSSGSAIQKRINNKLETRQIFDKYHHGDNDTIKMVDTAIHSLAHGLYSICCLLDPHKVVFGGSVMNYQPFVVEKLKEYLQDYLTLEQEDFVNRIYLSKHRGDAGVLGAGMKVLDL